MLNMLATLAQYERELIVERVNAGIVAARQSGTRFGRPASVPVVIALQRWNKLYKASGADVSR
jgi:DNA invertase Pin-like site-specific DNA recombinase